MNELELHEQFEMETLEEMRKNGILKSLVFGGGTMLRLCHQLPRYSVDLDFYIKNFKDTFEKQFNSLPKQFEKWGVEITDKQKKHFTYLIEIRRPSSPRKLKIEIRKENEQAKLMEPSLAFSPTFPNIQVAVTTCSLRQMAINKTDALIQRKLPRDAYDIEFLMRRGVDIFQDMAKEQVAMILSILNNIKQRELINGLGPLLPPKERERIFKTGFSLLIGKLKELAF